MMLYSARVERECVAGIACCHANCVQPLNLYYGGKERDGRDGEGRGKEGGRENSPVCYLPGEVILFPWACSMHFHPTQGPPPMLTQGTSQPTNSHCSHSNPTAFDVSGGP